MSAAQKQAWRRWQIVWLGILLACSLAAFPAVAQITHTGPPVPAAESWDIPPHGIEPSRLEMPADSVLLSLLSFTVGVGASLLVVSQMLPALVRRHCAETVREYMEFAHKESEVRVVMIDRADVRADQSHTLTPRRRAPVVVEQSKPAERRVDRPQGQPVPSPSSDEMQAILAHVYEQNVQLRDQLRQQSENT